MTEHWRTSSIRICQFDRVDTHAYASFYLSQCLLGKRSITEKTIALLGGQLGELKVLTSRRTIYSQSSRRGKICTNAEVLERAQACVHRHVVLLLSLACDDLVKLRSLEFGGLALDASDGVHRSLQIIVLGLELGV